MLLKKKRPSSSSTLSAAAVEENKASIPMPSPPTTPKKGGSGMNTSSSPLRTRLSSITPSPSHLKTVVAKKVKRQIQRLDDALHNVTLRPARSRSESVAPSMIPDRRVGKHRGGAKSRRASEGISFPVLSSVAIIHALPTLSSSSSYSSTASRQRTSSTPKDEDRYYDKRFEAIEKQARHRTTSCPNVIPSKHSMASLGSESTGASSDQEDRVQDPLRPPAVYVEPEVPDPFLVDDEGDALSEEGTASEGRQTTSPAAADSVPLSVSPSPSPAALSAKPLPSPFLSPNVNKDVPPPPVSDTDEDDTEDGIPDLSLPSLVIPTMFLPIPNTDPLTTLINKYIYPPEKRPARDVTGDWQHSDFHTLVMTNSWRALARMARDRIVAANPADVNLILGLWYLRLSCLARLRLFNQTAAECTNLFSVLNAIEPVESREYLFEHVLPFELEVMHTRLKYWSGDHMGYLDALTPLLNKCKMRSRLAWGDETTSSMWKERGTRIVLIIASQLVEMKEYTASARLLEPLCEREDVTNPALRSAIARIYLQVGNIQMAAKHFNVVAEDPTVDERQKRMNEAMLASARGEWESASSTLQEMIEKDNEDYAAVNNLSVALLSQGKLKEGIEVLESALKASPSSVVVAEPFLFNLSTLYELRSMLGFEKKRHLLVEVAKWSGDGLKTACLKLPAN